MEEYYVGPEGQAELEQDEVIRQLRCRVSRPDVLDMMLDEGCYTKRGRINRSALARKCGINPSTLDKLLKEFRAIAEALVD